MSNESVSNESKYISYLPGFILWVIAEFVVTDPILSYLFAWASSFFIFYWTIFSKFRFLNNDLPFGSQILRPIIIIQLVFAGFMCCTSIFYFLDHLGYRYFEKVDFNLDIPNEQTYIIAHCQRLSLLAHACLVTGIILLSPVKNGNHRRFIIHHKINLDTFLWKFSVCTFIGGVLIKLVPGFQQFSGGLTSISVFSGTFLLVKGLAQKKNKLLFIGGAIFISNLIKASLSGFKEPILMGIIILGCLLYPVYKRVTLYVGLPLIYMIIYFLPTYVGIIRAQSWSGDQSAEQSRSAAIDVILDQDNTDEIENTNWAFLTDRFSEIDMFTKFVKNTPDVIDYYGFDIIIDSIYALIPRVLWDDKPNTEDLSMQRVYDAGVINTNSIVSAKTRPVVDAYLSFGTMGVFLTFILLGIIAQALCNYCENNYGGYQFGSLILMGAFSDTLWRGNNFEFMFNSLFYGFILVVIINRLLLFLKILKPLEIPTQDNQEIFFS
jgi:hypothetical protein